MKRKLTDAQMGYLDAMCIDRRTGVCKGDIPTRDWRIIDRLEELGLCRPQHIIMQGTCYLITEAGDAARAAR